MDLDKAEKNVRMTRRSRSTTRYAAIDEAEYEVLDAALARKEADELAAGSSA